MSTVNAEVANDAASGHAPEWRVLFDGTTLDGWEAGVYGDDPELDFTDDGVVLPIGVPITGITYRGELPARPFTIEVDATKQYGSDFFLAVTFPVRDAHLTLVLGGWGGVVCGLSNLDDQDASGNDTTTNRSFPNGKRERVRIDVSDAHVKAWLGDECIVDVPLEGREVSIRPEVQPSTPLGLASFATVTTVHRVRIRAGAAGESEP